VNRGFGLRDVIMIKQLQPQGVAFDLRRLLLHTSTPMLSALLGYVTRHHMGAITRIHEVSQAKNLRGFVQVWPGSDRQKWDLAFLSPSLDGQREAPDIWRHLLTDLIIFAAEHGVLRIYARAPERASVEDTLRQVGFTMVTREEVFALTHPPVAAPLPKGLRRVGWEDQWILDELYHQVTPPLVQQAEGRGQHWYLKPHRTCDQFIWIQEGQAIAYLKICATLKGHWLDIMVRPEYRADILPHIKYVLTLTHCSPSMPVYCPLADYCAGLSWLLRMLGFESFRQQALLVAHTVSRVPVRRPIVIPGLERSVDVRTTIERLPPGFRAKSAELSTLEDHSSTIWH